MEPLFVLVTPTVKRQGILQFSTLQMLQLHAGFRSVYCFRTKERDEVLQQGHLRRLQHLPVVAVELLVDFDDEPLQAQLFQEYLQDHGYTFNMYDSGNRSKHFHVMTTWHEGAWVPYAQREWVRSHAPGADLTIYRQAGLFRLPGTWHEKRAGYRKKLLISVAGRPLDVPRIETPVRAVPLVAYPSAEAKLKLDRGAGKTQIAGGRRVHAWYLGAMAHDAGLGLDEAIDVVLGWNQEYAVPALDPEVIINKVEEAFLSRSMEDT